MVLVSADLDRRLRDQELDLPRHLAKVLARELDGRAPLGAASRLRGVGSSRLVGFTN